MDDFPEEPVIRSSTKIIAWIVTLLVLGGVWVMAAVNLPKRDLHVVLAEPGAASAPVVAGVGISGPTRQHGTISQSYDDPMSATDSPIPALQARSQQTPPESDVMSGTASPDKSRESATSSEQGSGVASATRGAECRSEVERLCPSNLGPEGRRRCVQANESSLPAGCRQELAQQRVRMRGDPEEMRLACEADVRRFCRNATSGRMPVLQCLRAHARDLSEDCWRGLSRMSARM
jgi:hypothetical protein